MIFSFRIVCLVFSISLFSSCIITRTPGFYSGYKRLSVEQRNRVKIVNDKDTLTVLNDSLTYAITARHLKGILKSTQKSIVYFWAPKCHSSVCISLSAFLNFCRENNYSPIIVSVYFDYEQIAIQGIKNSSVLAINHWHYGTDYCDAYERKFKKSLFKEFNSEFDSKAFSKYIYYDGKTISTTKPLNLDKCPW